MNLKHIKKFALPYSLCLTLLLVSSPAFADWSANIGYHNPPGATVGLNFLYRGSKWGFEAGIGWINADTYVEEDDDDDDKGQNDDTDPGNGSDKEEDDETGADIWMAGDIDVKYFFSSGGFTPYLQVGFGSGLNASIGDDNGASAGLGSPYGGLGVMAGKSYYLYLSANANVNRKLFFQAGLGVDI